MIKCVIFDLDDTLISETEYIKSGYKVVSEHLSKKYNMSTAEIYDKLLNLYKNKTKYVFNEFLDNENISYNQEDILDLINIYRNHVPVIHFYNDVVPFIEKLKKNNVKTAIITDGYKETQRNKINVLGLDNLIDYIIVTDELGKEYWKPHKKAFEMVANYFNIDYNSIVYIGDNPKKDFYIGKTLKIKTIRIIRKDSIYTQEKYLENVEENYCTSELSVDLLSKLESRMI